MITLDKSSRRVTTKAILASRHAFRGDRAYVYLPSHKRLGGWGGTPQTCWPVLAPTPSCGVASAPPQPRIRRHAPLLQVLGAVRPRRAGRCSRRGPPVVSLSLHHSHAFAVTRRFSKCLGRYAPDVLAGARADALQWCRNRSTTATPRDRSDLRFFLRDPCPAPPAPRRSSHSGGASQRMASPPAIDNLLRPHPIYREQIAPGRSVCARGLLSFPCIAGHHVRRGDIP
jgi:hypothetical protein